MRSILSLLLILIVSQFAFAQSKDLGNGFRDLGVAAPISNHRGLVATDDGRHHNIVLLWLMDHRGGYALLMLDANTGNARQVPMPFAPSGDTVDSPYASVLSREKKFYTHFNGYFVEFDPSVEKFTFSHKAAPQMAMSMTEDDGGIIWSATYPQAGLVSFNPKTREFHDYGHVYPQNFNEYPRNIAADDAGWIYFAIGTASSQIIMFDPGNGKTTPVFGDGERKQGSAYVYRDVDGKVYGQALHEAGEPWYEFYKGAFRRLAAHPSIHPKPEIAGTQALSYTAFPDGAKLVTCDLVGRTLAVLDDGAASPRHMNFDYTSEGADIMGAIASPDGTIIGGTTFPMRCFNYDPKSDRIVNHAAYGQWNTTATQGRHVFAGGYPGGFLLDWNTDKPYVGTDAKKSDSNPAVLVAKSDPDLHRPTHTFATADGKTVIMAGTPDYGYTGGGLLIYDRESHSKVLLTDKELVPDQSTASFVMLNDHVLLAGTTTGPGTGGIKKAHEAVMYELDLASKKIQWQAAVIPGVQHYSGLYIAPHHLIYGVADGKAFFVYEPTAHKVLSRIDLEKDFGLAAGQQGPRIFFPGRSSEETFMLVRNGIATIDPKTHEVKLIAKSPVPVEAGGDYLEGRIYFVHGSHLYSYEVGK